MTDRRCNVLLASLVVVVALGLGVLPRLAYAGQKALLIGINVYPYLPEKSQLRGSRPDALAMKEFLVEHWGFSTSDVRTLLDRQATKKAILDGLYNWLPRVTAPGDRIVVFFSGHGTQVPDTNGDEADGRDEAWSPSDSKSGRENFVNSKVTDDQIAAAFRRLSGREVLLISDSCHSGTLARGSVFETSPEAVDARERYIPPPAGVAPAETIRVRDEDPMSREVGAHLTLSAAMPHQYSWDTGSGGVFTKHLIHALTDLRADLNSNGRVTTAEAINYMKPRLDSWCREVPKCASMGFTPNLDPRNETFVLMPRTEPEESLPVVEEDDPGAVSDVLPTVEAGSISVEIHPDDHHRIGDEVTFTLTSTVDGHLTLLDLTAGGELILLFPTEEDVRRGKSGRIRANHPLHVPDKSYGFTFEAAPPTGRGQLIAMVTEDHVDLSDLLEEYGDFEPIEDPVKFMKSVSGRLHEVWTGDSDKNRGARWAVGYTDYRISE